MRHHPRPLKKNWAVVARRSEAIGLKDGPASYDEYFWDSPWHTPRSAMHHGDHCSRFMMCSSLFVVSAVNYTIWLCLNQQTKKYTICPVPVALHFWTL